MLTVLMVRDGAQGTNGVDGALRVYQVLTVLMVQKGTKGFTRY